MRFRDRILLLATPVLLLGCMGADGATGPDGADGGTAVALTWSFTPRSISMTDQNFPRVFTKDTYYWTLPGSYSLSYTAWDGSFWNGNYSVSYDPGTPGEPGEKGGMFWRKGRDGAPGLDGLDFFYRIGLYSTGPTITFVGTSVFAPEAIAEASVIAEEKKRLSDTLRLPVAVQSTVSNIITNGPWTVRYTFRRLDSTRFNSISKTQREIVVHR